MDFVLLLRLATEVALEEGLRVLSDLSARGSLLPLSQQGQLTLGERWA